MTFLRALVLGTALVALAACATVDERPAVCRVVRGPDGIGGTGASSDVLTRLVAGDRGMGGTGISGADNRGMGGTGMLAQNGDRGMGGTGIGNTGIIGVVTGFGSICVNGYEIELADSTKVTVEKLPAMPGDIRLGSVVEVEAFRDKGKLTAAAVNVRMAVAGPVESVAPDGLTAVVAGQTVRSSALARREDFARLRPGEWVAVSGLRRGDDVVVATSLAALERPGRDVLVAGPVRIEADGRRRIGALTLADSHIAAGQSAVARGTIAAPGAAASAAMTLAGTASVEMPPEFATRVANLSVEGFATALDSTQVRVGTITAGVTQTLAGVFKTDLGGQVMGGQVVVQLEGRLGTAGGVFTTDRVLLPERPLDGTRVTSPDGTGSVFTLTPGRIDPSSVRPELVPGSVGGTPQNPPRPDMSGATLKP